MVADRNSFDSEDGEELGDVDETIARTVLDQQRGGTIDDSTRRLSRESVGHPVPQITALLTDSSLEEGFMDDSDDEDSRSGSR